MGISEHFCWSELAQLTARQQQAMAFLWEHLPESDLDCYPAELFLAFADHALFLRETAAWCHALDWEIFAHYVLFPRVNDEDLSFHRTVFYDSLWPQVKDISDAGARALEVNRWCHEHASYEAQDERTASPLTVYRNGSGRCGEESAFLVSALRSVGIAARQVYAPRWSHCDDNHAWVEVLCGDTWHFMGACEPEPVLDRGWFTTAASKAMLVHSRIFGEGCSPRHGTWLGRCGGVQWFNQTSRYAEVKTYRFQAFFQGKPAAGAVFQLQILNEASFHTIASLTADAQGQATAELGYGSLHVFAALGDAFAEGDCGEDGLTLYLDAAAPQDSHWIDFRFLPPEGLPDAPAVLDSTRKAERAEVLQNGNMLRQKWIASAGNGKEIQDFLSGEDGAARQKLVDTLCPKDLRDVTCQILEDHFTRLPPRGADVPEDIFWHYVACPRIALEKLTPWRSVLLDWLDGWSGSPELLWQRLEDASDGPGDRLYQNLYWTPDRISNLRRCDEKSLLLFLTAALRTLGIPARLRTLDGRPEVWRDGGFQLIRQPETASLRLNGPEGNWTLSQWTSHGWKLLRHEGKRELVLPAGAYRLLTSVRLPNGSQFASRRDLRLKAGELREITLHFQSYQWQDVLGSQAMPVFSAVDLEGRPIPDFLRQENRPTLAVWLEEGGEPTEHILNELLEQHEKLDMLPVRVIFLVRSRSSLHQATLAKVLSQWRRPEVLLDDWAYDLEAVARRLGQDPDALPLIAVCDGAGRAVYSVGGYQVGSVQLIAHALAFLSPKS